MTTTTETAKSNWDLSHVLDFVHSLAPNQDAVTEQSDRVLDELTNQESELDSNDAIGLGDFSKVWQFLGTPKHTTELPAAPTKDDYASDGATYKHQTPPQKAPSIGTDGEELTASASDTPALTKTQRKKLRRKERKAVEEAKRIQQATVSESEADYPDKDTPARKASTHVVSTKPTASQRASSVIRSVKQAKDSQAQKQKTTPETSTLNKTSSKDGKISDSEAASAVAKAVAALKEAGGMLPSTPTPNSRYSLRSNNAVRFTPSSLRPPLKPIGPLAVSSPQTPGLAPPLLDGKPVHHFVAQPPMGSRLLSPNINQTKAKKPQTVIEPTIVRSGEDRQWALLLKIINDFTDDRKYLVKPMNMTTHNNDPTGIHVFVDASNIFIGFMDQLKRSRNIHPTARVPDVTPSFDSLALLMERRRPVARRVLAGSKPHISAFDVAKAVGYECCILEKVFKARELTQRQLYFQEVDRRRFGKLPTRPPPVNNVIFPNVPSPVPGPGEASGSGSGSETNTPQYAPPKMVEQGVDEILHMKILESIVDCQEPSTIVLASGDAAAAEYSDGFQAMVYRALGKGWKVELVSWSKNISSEYKKQAWSNAWGDQFKIIYLDDYAEELLEM